MAHNTCKYCGAKLRLISIKGGFCSFTCRAKWKAYKQVNSYDIVE